MAFRAAVASDLAARLFTPGSPQALHLLRCAWPVAVGSDLARRTELLALEGTTLRVRVPDARWRKVLHRMQPQILSRLRDVAGSVAPRRLGFDEGDVAGVTEIPATDSRPAPLAPNCPASIVESAAAIEDLEIRGLFLEVAAHYLSRSPSRS